MLQSVAPTDIAAGILSALIVQWVKTNPKFAFLTPEMVRTLQAVMIILSALVGVLHAASEPGGLAAQDWQHTLKTVFEAAATAWVSGQMVYTNIIRPQAKALEAKKAESATQ